MAPVIHAEIWTPDNLLICFPGTEAEWKQQFGAAEEQEIVKMYIPQRRQAHPVVMKARCIHAVLDARNNPAESASIMKAAWDTITDPPDIWDYALPLAALQFHDVEITFKFSK